MTGAKSPRLHGSFTHACNVKFRSSSTLYHPPVAERAPASSPRKVSMSFFTPTSSAVSLKDTGNTVTGIITSPVTQRQAKKFGTDELAFWPARNGRPAEPVMEAIINLREVGTNLDRTLYVSKSRMRNAIGTAMSAAGAPDLEVGATLTVTNTGTEKGKGSFPATTFSAEYVRPTAETLAVATPAAQAAAAAPAPVISAADPFAAAQAPAVAQQAAADPYAGWAAPTAVAAAAAAAPADPWGAPAF